MKNAEQKQEWPVGVDKLANDLGRGIYARVMKVTPHLAEQWRKKNFTDNRPIREPFVASLAYDMQSEAWRLTHQAVAFDAEGNLIDGQHRLMAVQQSGISCWMLVIWNMGSDFHDPIDRGRPRSLAMITGLRTRSVATLNALRGLMTGYTELRPLTVAEVDDLQERFGKDLEDVLQNTPGSVSRLPGGFLAAAVWALPVERESVLEFIKQVATGEMIARGQPSYALRRWFEMNKRMQSREHALAALGCASAHVRGTTMASVYVAEAGYRHITGMRRARKIPNTPSTEIVPTSGGHPSGHRSSSGETEESEEPS